MGFTESSEDYRKYAIVDLGSNTVRLSVYQVGKYGRFKLMFSVKEMAGLNSFIVDRRLTADGIKRACDVLQKFKVLLEQFAITDMHVFATASLRNIDNSREAVDMIRGAVGTEITVVSGEMEARLGFMGALDDFNIINGATFDIGGGSTEITEVQDGEVMNAQSISIGSLDLFKRHVSRIWPKKVEIEEIRMDIDRNLLTLPITIDKRRLVCGIGGTARAALKISNAYFGRSSDVHSMIPEDLDVLLGELLARKKDMRDLTLKICPDRTHTLIPGMMLMRAVCRKLKATEIYISPYGVREGYLKYLIDQEAASQA